MTTINLLDDMMRNFSCEQTADCDDGVAAPLTSFLAGIKVKKMKTVRIRRLVITAEEEIVVAGHQIVGNRITWMAERSNLGWKGRGGGNCVRSSRFQRSAEEWRDSEGRKSLLFVGQSLSVRFFFGRTARI